MYQISTIEPMIPGYHIRIGHTLLPLLLAQGSCLQRAGTTWLGLPCEARDRILSQAT